MNNKKFPIIAIILIALAVGLRIVLLENYLYNFAPLVAIGLFSGSIIKDAKWAFIVAILSQFIVDVYFQLFTNVPGFYGLSQIFTYAGLLAATGLGRLMADRKAMSVVGFTVAGSLLFFVLSNFGVWASGVYGYTGASFINTFILGLPFLKNAMMADMMASGILFGTAALFVNKAIVQKANA